jgi:hypothetical protein
LALGVPEAHAILVTLEVPISVTLILSAVLAGHSAGKAAKLTAAAFILEMAEGTAVLRAVAVAAVLAAILATAVPAVPQQPRVLAPEEQVGLANVLTARTAASALVEATKDLVLGLAAAVLGFLGRVPTALLAGRGLQITAQLRSPEGAGVAEGLMVGRLPAVGLSLVLVEIMVVAAVWAGCSTFVVMTVITQRAEQMALGERAAQFVSCGLAQLVDSHQLMLWMCRVRQQLALLLLLAQLLPQYPIQHHLVTAEQP